LIRSCGITVAALGVVLGIAGKTFADEPATRPVAIPVPVIPDKIFNVMDYGASGRGEIDDTAHLQAAIDACAAAGGGTVLLPRGGVFLSNALTVTASHTHIQIDGTLLCQLRPKYTDPKKSLITFLKAHDVQLDGSGVIEGQGGIGPPSGGWWGDRASGTKMPAASSRPRLVRFTSCDTVLIRDLTLRNSPSFHFIFGMTDNVRIDHITIRAPSSEASQVPAGALTSHNTDGIDPHGSNYVITNCDISDGDDDIVIVATNPVAKNIFISHCKIGTGHGLSIGDGGGGVDGMWVSDCTFDGTTNGIRMKSNRREGGLMQNIHFSDFTMTNVTYPIYLTDWYTSQKGDPSNPAHDTGTPNPNKQPIWRNITIRNLTSTSSPPKGIIARIWGTAESPIENIFLTNVKIAGTNGLDLYNVRNLTCDADTRFIAQGGNAFGDPHNTGMLPAGFSQQEIGNPTVPADSNPSLFDPGRGLWTIDCEGAGIANGGDQVNYCARPAAEISMIAATLSNIVTKPMRAVLQAGPMFRASGDPGAPFAALWQTSDGELIFQWRVAAGQPVASALAVPGMGLDRTQIKLTRTPAGVCAAYCPDSVNWNQIGSAVPVNGLDGPDATVGLAATGNIDGMNIPATFSQLQISK
jgi:polygalacturonase